MDSDMHIVYHVAKSGLCSHNLSFLCVFFRKKSRQTFGGDRSGDRSCQVVCRRVCDRGQENMAELFGSKRFCFFWLYCPIPSFAEGVSQSPGGGQYGKE